MLTIFVHRNGEVSQVPEMDPGWLQPQSGAIVWVDLTLPDGEQPVAEAAILRDVFGFHPLAIEDALSESHHPKIEPYDNYLYLILHGIDFQAAEHEFATQDTDFFLGGNHLVTVHAETVRTIPAVREMLARNGRILGEGAPALLHRIVDTMIDHYRPEGRIDFHTWNHFNGWAGFARTG